MFLIDAAIVLPHPPHAVARVVQRLHLMPRWCVGLRRVRAPAPVTPPESADLPSGSACLFSYDVTGVRLVLRAHTLARAGDAAHESASAGAVPSAGVYTVTHIAEGDGLTLTWTLTATECVGPLFPHAATDACTELRARVEVRVDAAHPLAEVRAALCRVVARRVPADLERLRVLLAEYDASRPAPPAAPELLIQEKRSDRP